MFRDFLAKRKKQDYFWIAGLLVLLLLSMTVLRSYYTSEGYTAPKIEYLDQKKGTVMELAAVSTTASAAISAIPGDAGTPISEKLADLSTYSLIVICALFLEKYLLALTGDAVFLIVIPLACLLGIAYYAGFRRDGLRRFAVKLASIGLVLQFIVPTSVYVSEKIEETISLRSQRRSRTPRRVPQRSRRTRRTRLCGISSLPVLPEGSPG